MKYNHRKKCERKECKENRKAFMILTVWAVIVTIGFLVLAYSIDNEDSGYWEDQTLLTLGSAYCDDVMNVKEYNAYVEIACLNDTVRILKK